MTAKLKTTQKYQTLTIVRGLPGSGKSTYAANNRGNAFVVEADQFFLVEGVYKFDRSLISHAHEWCIARTIMMLRNGEDVVVANTFVELWSLAKYFRLKMHFPELHIRVIEMHTQYKSVHNVPDETMKRMELNWQEISPNMVESYEIELIKVVQ